MLLSVQDFETVVLKNKNNVNKTSNAGKHKIGLRGVGVGVGVGVSHEIAVARKLDHSDMGDNDVFERNYRQLQTQQKQFRSKFMESRKNKNMTQQQFATLLNIKKEDVQRIEAGRIKTEPALIQKFMHLIKK